MKLLIIFFATLTFAAEQKSTPIRAEDILIVQALAAGLQQHQNQVSEAIAKQEIRLCGEAKIKRDVCFVDWQKGEVSLKPKVEPPSKIEPKQPESAQQ